MSNTCVLVLRFRAVSATRMKRVWRRDKVCVFARWMSVCSSGRTSQWEIHTLRKLADEEDGNSSLWEADANSKGCTSDRAASSTTRHGCLPCDEKVELFLSLMAPCLGRFWRLSQPDMSHVHRIWAKENNTLHNIICSHTRAIIKKERHLSTPTRKSTSK